MVDTKEKKKCKICGLETENGLIMKYHICSGVLLNKELNVEELDKED